MSSEKPDAVANTDAAPALAIMAENLRRQHGSAVNTLLYYGSCLRSNDPFDGIVDAYLIVDKYSAVYKSKFQAFANWLLPPNVFYKEIPVENRVLRVKYSVLSNTDLQYGLSGRSMHSYLWGRFSQPVQILWFRDEVSRENAESCLKQAVSTFLERVLPGVASSGSVTELWEQGLRMSYATELRSEGPDRARELVHHAVDHYVAATRGASPSIRYPLRITGSGVTAQYSVAVPVASRVTSRCAWWFRRVLGKILSVARLFKALFTFEGGLDYAAWKLGRHSGQSIEIPERVRRHPLIFSWHFLWKLYRRGVIR